MSGNKPGEWGGKPNESSKPSSSGGGFTVITSPNRGKEGAKTTYKAQVFTDADGNAQGNIFIRNSETGDVACLRYSTEGGTMDDMGRALEDLEAGELPDAEAADYNNVDPEGLENMATELDGEEKGKEKQKFNLWRFLGLKKRDKGEDGFMLPLDENDMEEIIWGTGDGEEDGPFIGPIVLWARDNKVGIRAAGGRDVNAWMNENWK